MNHESQISDCAEAARIKTLAVIKSLQEKCTEFDLPRPPSGLEQYRQKLESNIHEVLVVGEAKRGKSTFVNALIGRDILPTDVDIATSQVFRICPAVSEAYRLRFEDDSQQTIAAADLPRYGSQVIAEAEGSPRLDQIIRWIEADLPVRFLPPNLRILDTPGLGALYAAHAQITHRFVPLADAVVFVLDSQAPISDAEVKFVEKLLDVTRNIFFIQTKIDLFHREAWQEVQKRNQEILGQRFKDRLTDFKVWPISSTNLRKAAETGDDDYLMVSRHKELAEGLKAFLFRVAGWGRAAEAIVVSEQFYQEARRTLTTRLSNLLDATKQGRTETQRQVRERTQSFEADWGERGEKRRALMTDVRKEIEVGRQRMRQCLQPGAEIESRYVQRIESLQSFKELQELATKLGETIANDVCSTWQSIQSTAKSRLLALFVPLAAESTHLLEAVESSSSVTQSALQARFEVSGDSIGKWFDRNRAGIMAASVITSATGISLFNVSAALAMLPWPLAVAGIAAATIASNYGRQTALENQVRNSRLELLKHLHAALQRIRQNFFDVDQASGRFGLVEEFFAALERAANEQILAVFKQKTDAVRSEISRLTKEAELSDSDRKAKSEETQSQLAAWDAIGLMLTKTKIGLQELDQASSPSTVSV